MTYFNFEYAKAKGISPNQIICLQLIKQNRTEDVSEFIDVSHLEYLQNKKLITYIKGTSKQTELQKVRLTKKGNRLLEDIQIPEVTEGDLKMAEYLMKMYLAEDENRIIGNKKKVKMYCAIFRKQMQFSLHEMYWLCWLFIDEYKFSKKLENVFFNADKNRYGDFKSNIEDSPLYQFFDENKEKVIEFWKKRIK